MMPFYDLREERTSMANNHVKPSSLVFVFAACVVGAPNPASGLENARVRIRSAN